MRFRTIRAVRFGPLDDRVFDASGGIVLVHGPNMSGKSSFRHALETILYGFEPAKREAHPLWAWSEGADLQLEAEIVPDETPPFRVERILQATGKQRRAAIGEPFAGARAGNAPLPEVAVASRSMFRSVYGLTLDDLREFEDDLTQEIDHLLLPVQAGLTLRPTREVVRELEAEHAALWHRDRRRGAGARAVRDQSKALRKQLEEALERDESLREARDELERIRQDLPLLEEERGQLQREDRRSGFLEAVFNWRRESSRLSLPPDLSALEGGRLEDPRVLDERVDELEEEIEPFRARLKREPVEVDEADLRLLAQSGAIEAIEIGGLKDLRRSVDAAASTDADARRKWHAELEEIVEGEVGPEKIGDFRTVKPETIAAAIDDWDADVERGRRLDDRNSKRRALGSGMLVIGVSLLALGVSVDALEWLAVIGGVLAAAGGAALFLCRPIAAERTAEENGSESLREKLGRLRVDPAFLQSPQAGRRLNERLRQLRGGLESLDTQGLELSRLSDALDERVAALRTLSRQLGRDDTADGPMIATALREALRSARDAESKAEQDRNERELAEENLRSREPALVKAMSRRDRTFELLRAAIPEESDPGAAHDEHVRREDLRRTLAREEGRLRDDPQFEDCLAELPADPTRLPDDAPWSAEIAAARSRRLAEIETESGAKQARRGGLEEMLRAAPGSEAARIKEQIDAGDARLVDIKHERDRLALLENVLREADRAYREQHQPDVLRNANVYLTSITAGAMNQLEYGGESGVTLHVTPEERDEPVPVESPLSRGTRDQIHLCLRLGLLDHLDRDNESLPLVLDEVLVNWDEQRRRRVYPLLREVSKIRQVFLLTCHESFASEAERELGVERIAL